MLSPYADIDIVHWKLKTLQLIEQYPLSLDEIKEEKSGYYITVNFYGTTLTLLRLGWIDFEDWQPQKAATGQAATLKDEVYQHKLIEITGEYRLNAPVGLLEGIGKKRIKIFASEGIKTMRDLLDYEGNNEFIQRFKDKAKNLGTT